MSVEPRDPIVDNTFLVAFRSHSLAIADRVAALDGWTTDDNSGITSHNYALAYPLPITGKQMHCVQVVYYLGSGTGQNSEVNGARIFNQVIPEDAEICYYVDTDNGGTHGDGFF